MIKVIIFDLWETLGTKNVGISKSLRDKFNIEKTDNFMELYESSVQLKEWESEEDMAINFLEEFKLEKSEENVNYVINLFREGIEKATVFSGMKDLLVDLKKNYKLGIISNTTIFESVVLDKWGIKDLFDVVSFSYKIGSKKPDKKIFDVTLEKLGISSEEVVFVDDGKNNIQKAIEYGLNGIVFESAEQLQIEFKKLNIKI